MTDPKVTVVNPIELASLLGVERNRMHFEVKNTPLDGKTMVSVEVLIDGKDLDAKQEKILRRWLEKRVGAPFTVASK